MKIIGIIGGFGPEATAKFYRLLAAKTHAHIIVRHVAVPRKLVHDALVFGENMDAFLPLLVETARDLERNGADLVVLPCNTLHIHEAAIRQSIGIPFVSIVDATVGTLRKHNVRRAGLLGSRVTVQNNLFENHGIDVVTVKPSIQRNIDRALDQFVSTQDNRHLREALNQAFKFLTRKGIKNILVACTDFSGICPIVSGIKLYDTLTILADEVMRKTSKSYFYTASKRGGVSPW